MLQQTFTIAANTFQESIRQPIFSVLLLVAAVALVLNPSLAAYTLEDDNQLLVDLGLSTLFLAGLLVAAFTATGSISAEIENKTVLTVVSKPVPRPVFILGKYAGVAAALAVAYWILSIVFLLTIRHRVMQTVRDPFDGPVLLFGLAAAFATVIAATLANYFYQRVFTSTLVLGLAATMTAAWGLVLLIDKQWHFQSITTEFQAAGSLQSGQLLLALILIFLALLMLTAIAVAASTRLGQVMTLLTCTLALLVGLVSDYVFGVHANEYFLARLMHLLAPNLQLLWPTDALIQGSRISAAYIAQVAAYAALYTTATLALAIALFQRRDIG